jgi:DNA-binding PadR family transcriptional regulator
MQSLAGLSPGATIPILQSLVEDGYVTAGKPGTRARVAYVVTSKGKKWLEAVWPSLLQEGPSGDLDSDLRVFLIAIRVGKDRVRAEAFLRNAVAHRQETLAELDAKLREEGSRIGLADHYVSFRSSDCGNPQSRGRGDRFDLGRSASASTLESGATSHANSVPKGFGSLQKRCSTDPIRMLA